MTQQRSLDQLLHAHTHTRISKHIPDTQKVSYLVYSMIGNTASSHKFAFVNTVYKI